MPSTGVKEQEELQDIEEVPKQDQKALNFYISQLNDARDQRLQPRPEFDDMTYDQDYVANQRAGHSFLRRKKNDDEVRVNTGTTEKKIELMLNELSAMNYQAEVEAFDENDLEVRGIGDDMGEIIERTNKFERDDDTYEDAFLELLVQRAVFMEEVFAPLPTAMTMTGKSGKFSSTSYVQKRLLSGLNMFLGDITIPARLYHEQPFIVKYDRMLYDEAEKFYRKHENFKFVRPGQPASDTYGLQFKYRFGNLKQREVEIITYMSACDNEYQIIINGVMMFEPGTKLPWNHTGYNSIMVVVKPMSPFLSYGKQPLASAKFLQGLNDETFRNLIRKFRQAVEPPIGMAGGKIYSREIWSPASITQGIKEGDITRLIDHQGVTTSEYQMLELIQTKIDEFIGPYGAANTPGAPTQTATQVIEQQKQSMKMLGRAMLAAMRLKREMSYLRLHNIFDNYFKSTNGKYRNFTISNSDFGDGTSGKKIIALSDKSMTADEIETMKKHEKAAEAQGTPMRYHQINFKRLQDFSLTWYIVISSKERESSALDKLLFQDQVTQASGIVQLTGRQINSDKMIDDYERAWKVKGMFERNAPMAPGTGTTEQKAQGILGGLKQMQAPQPAGGVPSQVGAQMPTAKPPMQAPTQQLARA